MESTENAKKLNDYGAVIIAKIGKEVLIAQCKNYADHRSVGISAVQEIFTAKKHYKANLCIIVYRGNISRNAAVLAKTPKVELVHISELKFGCRFDRLNDRAKIQDQIEKDQLAATEQKISYAKKLIFVVNLVKKVWNDINSKYYIKAIEEYNDYLDDRMRQTEHIKNQSSTRKLRNYLNDRNL